MDIVDIINFYNPNIIKPQSKLLPFLDSEIVEMADNLNVQS